MKKKDKIIATALILILVAYTCHSLYKQYKIKDKKAYIEMRTSLTRY